MPSSWVVALDCIALSLLVLLVRSYYSRWRRNPSGLPHPPGPRPLPIVGNLFDLSKSASWVTYNDWAKKYGDLMSLTVLGQPLIIINSASIAQDLLDKRGTVYSDRPVVPMFELMGISAYNLILTRYSEAWRTGRKLANHSLHPTAAREYRPMQTRRAHEFLRNLIADPKEHMGHVRHLTTGIIMSLAYGYEISDSGDRYVALAEEAADRGTAAILPGAAIVNSIPFLRHFPAWLPGMGFKTFASETYDVVQEMLDAPFRYVKESIENGTARPSLTLDHLSKYTDGVPLEDERRIRSIAASLYAAGADTSATALSSFILAMVLYPDAQKRAQAEIDKVIGRGRLPDFEDRENLPYVEALCKELLRWKVVVPLAIAHATTEDDVYNGYFIPKGSQVLPNAWAMLHDPTTYPTPEKFQPERFLAQDGTVTDDPILSSGFGFGRRICPGQYLAESTIWIVAVSVLATLSIGKARDERGEEVVPEEGAYTGGLISMPLPFKCSIRPRDGKAAALVRATA